MHANFERLTNSVLKDFTKLLNFGEKREFALVEKLERPIKTHVKKIPKNSAHTRTTISWWVAQQ